MPFDYPNNIGQRRHGPKGYTDYTSYKPWLRDEFCFRCVYCLTRETWKEPFGKDYFAVEHIKPKGRRPDLETDYENLTYACMKCNSFKGKDWEAPNPFQEPYGSLLEVQPDGRITPRRADDKSAQEIIEILRLNSRPHVRFRQEMLKEFVEYSRAENSFDSNLLKRRFGFPDEQDLPDLESQKPPANARRQGIKESYLQRKRDNKLPDTFC